MKIKNCKITFWQCMLSLLWPIPTFVFGISSIIYVLICKIEWWFTLPFILFFWIFLCLYPIYVFCIYYKHDKKVKLTINFDDERMFIEYKSNDCNTIFIDVKDIIEVDSFHRYIIPLWYYELCVKDGERIIISSLLSNTSYLLCRLRVNTYDGMNLVPYEWRNNK